MMTIECIHLAISLIYPCTMIYGTPFKQLTIPTNSNNHVITIYCYIQYSYYISGNNLLHDFLVVNVSTNNHVTISDMKNQVKRIHHEQLASYMMQFITNVTFLRFLFICRYVCISRHQFSIKLSWEQLAIATQLFIIHAVILIRTFIVK